MNKEEFNIMTGIIDNATDNNDLDDLKKVRNYLNKKIVKLESNDYFKEEEYEILTQDLKGFLNGKILDSSFKRLSFVVAVMNIRRKNSVYVFDTIGLDESTLMKHSGIGQSTIEEYEMILNNYGLSMHMELTETQKEKLENFRQEEAKQKIK